ncbi:hypothetical protein K3556_12765 [Aliiroseovarius sp. M344]|uniref:hypothetical protein n=1 Tax=Aliiroseovarius sp. M344 TaxID=2867010 RepID=UPI0021AE1110|nr:hypothetical protein [Aliiroseovarius sp. M344]UWQ13790.1 hypothetical protein K3556_12765 [Aliiroseovarius sp. M344]
MNAEDEIKAIENNRRILKEQLAELDPKAASYLSDCNQLRAHFETLERKIYAQSGEVETVFNPVLYREALNTRLNTEAILEKLTVWGFRFKQGLFAMVMVAIVFGLRSFF